MRWDLLLVVAGVVVPLFFLWLCLMRARPGAGAGYCASCNGYVVNGACDCTRRRDLGLADGTVRNCRRYRSGRLGKGLVQTGALRRIA